MNDLNLGHLTNYQNKREADKLSARTIDYEVGTVKAMVTKAFYYDKIGGHALKCFKVLEPRLESGTNARKRVLSHGEYLRLLAASPRHLKNIIIVAFYTGMRKGEILKLTWPMVDRRAAIIRLPEGFTKNKQPRRIPINHHVAAVLNGLTRAVAHNYVFTYRNRNMTDRFNRAFISACEKAGIIYGRDIVGGVIFHDLRRTCKTNMLAAGVDKTYRDLIVGHALSGMDKNYLSPSDEQLAEVMERFTAWIDAEVKKSNVEYFVKKSQVA